jgi:pimeloyl-ACP methyl ester carboxylesterase
MSHPPLLLLHGALETSAQFDKLTARLCDHFEVHRFTFHGHGGSAPSDFSLSGFVQQTEAYLDEHQLSDIALFGYSMGGYVALELARRNPEALSKVATLGTILQWSPEKAKQECRFLDPDVIQEKVPHFAKHLEQLHGTSWTDLLHHTESLLKDLGNQPPLNDEVWASLNLPIRIHVGDRDSSADPKATFQVYQQLPQAELAVLPNTPHPFAKVNLDLLIPSLVEFLAT